MKKNLKFEIDGKKYSVDVERDGDVLTIEKEGETVLVNLLEGERRVAKPKPMAAPAAAPVAAAPAPAKSAAPAAAAGDIVAPMTGIIKQIKVSKGEAVKENQLVVVMEAMKMDIDILSKSDGTVAEVYVSPGNNVTENQPLIRFA